MNKDHSVQKNLSRNYSEEILNQQNKYFCEKKARILDEQEQLNKVQAQLKSEQLDEKIRKKKIMAMQYKDYLIGLHDKEDKLQKEFEEKLIPQNVSLQMNSEQRLKSYYDKINKLSDKADRNKKLFLDYNEKCKNEKFYNYLSKKYVHAKTTNQAVSENREMRPGPHLGSPDGNNNIFENESQNFDKNSYNKKYNAYKNVFLQYDNFNRIVAEQNMRNKDYMNQQKTLEELKRMEDRQNNLNYEKQEKLYENEKKKEYAGFLERQIKDQFPIKLWKENYNENKLIRDTNFFKEKALYDSAPNFSIVRKSNYVEVNPYNAKNYDLGKSLLEYNPIINPMINYNYNRYLFPKINDDETNNNGNVNNCQNNHNNRYN